MGPFGSTDLRSLAVSQARAVKPQDHKYEASLSCGMPVYFPAFASTTTLEWKFSMGTSRSRSEVLSQPEFYQLHTETGD